jgi:hypothetical protein
MRNFAQILPCAVLLLATLVASSQARAEHPPADEIAALRAVVEANFAAQTEGDVKGMMATISPRIAGQQRLEFEREVRDYVKLDTGLQLRLLSMKVSNYYAPWMKSSTTGRIVARQGGCSAVADVVQLTVPKGISYVELADYPKELSTDYRHNSAMLPSAEVVTYTLKFEFDFRDRRWKVFRITSKVRPVARWPKNVEAVLQGEPPEITSIMGPSVRKFSGN